MAVADDIRQDFEAGARRLEREYLERLVAAARKLGADDTEAEALAYRTIDEAVRSIGNYSEQSAFFSWLCKIMANQRSKDVRRKSAKTVSFSAETPEPSAPEVENDGAERIVEEIDAGILRDAIDNLPSSMKETVVLHYFMHQPVLKIAKVLSLPAGTVKSRLHYARILLSERLGGKFARRTACALGILAVACVGACATSTIVSRVFRWSGGGAGSRFDDPANWLPPADTRAGAIPGAADRLGGGCDYAFDMHGSDRTICGWNVPCDWDDHRLVVANGSLAFSGDVTTHTGELTVEKGGRLTLLEGSKYSPALFSAGKWTTRVRAGGEFALLGEFNGYSWRIVVEEGGKAVVAPSRLGGEGSSAQGGNAIENSGRLSLPSGLVWTSGGGVAEKYSVAIRQLGGVLEIGGPVAVSAAAKNRMRLSVEIAGGLVDATGRVSFAAHAATLASGVRFHVAEDASLDLSTFSVAPGASLSFSGEGEAILPAGRYGEIAVDGSATVRFAGAAEVASKRVAPGAKIVPFDPAAASAAGKVLRGAETLVVAEDADFPDGIATVPGPDGEIPKIVVEKGATMTVPGGTRFGDVSLVVRGTLAASSPGDLVLGYAPVGQRRVFALEVDGGAVSNAFGGIDFVCPDHGGTVSPSGGKPLVLRRAALHAAPGLDFDFGVDNPESERVEIRLEDTILRYGAGTHCVAGGVVLKFSYGARLFRPDAASEQADLVVRDRAQLFFGEGTDLHYGASANGFGSVGNGGISFIPSEDGFPSLVLDRATFWYHHPNSVRGRRRATLCATNATYEIRSMNWNYTNPFRGFRAVDVDGKIWIKATDGTGKFAWDGSDDPTDIRLPRNVPLTGAGEIKEGGR